MGKKLGVPNSQNIKINEEKIQFEDFKESILKI